MKKSQVDAIEQARLRAVDGLEYFDLPCADHVEAVHPKALREDGRAPGDLHQFHVVGRLDELLVRPVLGPRDPLDQVDAVEDGLLLHLARSLIYNPEVLVVTAGPGFNRRKASYKKRTSALAR